MVGDAIVVASGHIDALRTLVLVPPSTVCSLTPVTR